MMTKDLYESFSCYRMITADKDIIDKMEVLKLEKGISVSSFIRIAIYEKLKALGCDFSDHNPTEHTQVKREYVPKIKKQRNRGASDKEQLRTSLSALDMKRPSLNNSRKQYGAGDKPRRSGSPKSDVEELRESLFRIQYSCLYRNKGKGKG